jgi:hypothetical protein
VTGSGAP